MRKKQRNELILQTEQYGSISEVKTSAIKAILTSLVPLIILLSEKLADGRLNLFQKISVGFQSFNILPDLIAAASNLPDEAWRGDSYDPAEIDDIAKHMETLFPEEQKEHAKAITLSLMAWVLQTITAADTIIDTVRSNRG